VLEVRLRVVLAAAAALVAGRVVRTVLEVRLDVVGAAAVALMAGGVVRAVAGLRGAGGTERENGYGGYG
jgi:hypothetical protein